MRPRLTKHQVARAAHRDLEQPNQGRLYLFKACSLLTLTYQIAALTEEAARRGLKLEIDIPEHCKLTNLLRDHCAAHQGIVKLNRCDNGPVPLHF